MKKLKYLIKKILNYNLPGYETSIRDSDNFIVSYPKSGNTWMRFLLGNYIYDEDIDFESINRLVPDIHFSTKQTLDKMNNARFLKSHHNLDFFKKKPEKIIYIYRDPREVCVSYFFWYKKFVPSRFKDFNDFFNYFMSCESEFNTWGNHVLQYFEYSLNNQNIIFVNYRALKENTESEFTRIIKFLNLNIDPNRIKNAIQKSNFKSMRLLEESKPSFLSKTNQNIKFVRKQNSDWHEYLSKSQLKRIEDSYLIIYNFINGNV